MSWLARTFGDNCADEGERRALAGVQRGRSSVAPRRRHHHAAPVFAAALRDGVHQLEPPTDAELTVAIELAERCPDSRADFPDLVLMAMAARASPGSSRGTTGTSARSSSVEAASGASCSKNTSSHRDIADDGGRRPFTAASAARHAPRLRAPVLATSCRSRPAGRLLVTAARRFGEQTCEVQRCSILTVRADDLHACR